MSTRTGPPVRSNLCDALSRQKEPMHMVVAQSSGLWLIRRKTLSVPARMAPYGIGS
jgi:hypothetical protein